MPEPLAGRGTIMLTSGSVLNPGKTGDRYGGVAVGVGTVAELAICVISP